jgi:hypothetical protein
MDSPSFRTFLSQYANAGHQFIVFELVRDELLNKYSEELLDQKRDIDKVIREIRSRTGKEIRVPLSDDDINQMCDEYAEQLEEKFDQSKATIVGYPSVSHKDVVIRALQRRKPFDSEGHKGYRDVLIWESLLALITDDGTPVAFVCQNPRDFADKNTRTLHPSLQEEVSNLTHGHGEVIYFPDLERFVSCEIEPYLRMVDELIPQLTGEGYKGFDLKTFTQNSFQKFIEYERLEPRDLDLPRTIEELQISSIEEVDEIKNVLIHPLGGNDLLISYNAVVSMGLTFLIEHSAYFDLPDELLEKIEVWDSSWNEYYRMCQLQLNVIELGIKLIFNNENATVQSAELVSMSMQGRLGYWL